MCSDNDYDVDHHVHVGNDDNHHQQHALDDHNDPFRVHLGFLNDDIGANHLNDYHDNNYYGSAYDNHNNYYGSAYDNHNDYYRSTSNDHNDYYHHNHGSAHYHNGSAYDDDNHDCPFDVYGVF